MLDMGQNPRLWFEPIHESQLESLGNFMSRMAQVTEEAQAALVKAPTTWPDSKMPTGAKPQSMMSATRCGLAQEHQDCLSDEETQLQMAGSLHHQMSDISQCLLAQTPHVFW